MIFGLTADAVQLSFKGIIVDAQPVDDLWAGLDKDLRHERLALAGFFTQYLRGDRYVTPA